MAKPTNSFRNPTENAAGTLVFDFGGVLFDWNPRYLFRQFFDGDSGGMERFLAEIDFFTWDAGMDCGRPFREAVVEWCAKFPRHAGAIRAFDTRWAETVGGPIPGTQDLLLRLNDAGVPLYGLSNWSAEKFQILRGKYPYISVFRKILLSGEAGICKPDPRIFEIFLEQTGLQKEALLFIDDSPANIAAARSLGWSAVLFTSAKELEQELAGRDIL
jgi:2-haloacid dehalogenase